MGGPLVTIRTPAEEDEAEDMHQRDGCAMDGAGWMCAARRDGFDWCVHCCCLDRTGCSLDACWFAGRCMMDGRDDDAADQVGHAPLWSCLDGWRGCCLVHRLGLGGRRSLAGFHGSRWPSTGSVGFGESVGHGRWRTP
ncbi:hypothetical protein ACLOJK_006690 [Asimina triloba]